MAEWDERAVLAAERAKRDELAEMRSERAVLLFKCRHCDKKFVSNGSMQRHMYIFHSNIIAAEHNNFAGKVCPKCEKEFSSHSYMAKHIHKCKGKLDPFECEYCHKICTSRKTKSVHKKTCVAKMEDDRRDYLAAHGQ